MLDNRRLEGDWPEKGPVPPYSECDLETQPLYDVWPVNRLLGQSSGGGPGSLSSFRTPQKLIIGIPSRKQADKKGTIFIHVPKRTQGFTDYTQVTPMPYTLVAPEKKGVCHVS